jgi:hypothetical protein
MSDLTASDDYTGSLSRLKHDIQSARTRAALAVNHELVRLYHRIGAERFSSARAVRVGAHVWLTGCHETCAKPSQT